MSDGIILGIKSNGGGCYVGDERKFTAQDKKNLEANTKARHTHDNKALLDDLQKVLDGKVSAEDGKGLSTVSDINIFGAASVDAVFKDGRKGQLDAISHNKAVQC